MNGQFLIDMIQTAAIFILALTIIVMIARR